MKFTELAKVDVNKHTENKGRFTYLSWAWAWSEACKLCEPTRTIYKNDKGWNYHTDGRTCWVEVGVTIDGVEHIDMLPVMNNQNKAIPIESVTAMEVNKAIQRSTVKALALHGLGLYIYAGEDLPTVPELPSVDTIKFWIDKGKSKDECVAYIEKMAKENNLLIDSEYREMVDGI
jgi:hypothetical protein